MSDLPDAFGIVLKKLRYQLDCVTSNLAFWEGPMTRYDEQSNEDLLDLCQYYHLSLSKSPSRVTRAEMLRVLKLHQRKQILEDKKQIHIYSSLIAQVEAARALTNQPVPPYKEPINGETTPDPPASSRHGEARGSAYRTLVQPGPGL